MKKVFQIIAVIITGAMLLIAATGCRSLTRSLDVIANASVRSFSEVLDVLDIETDEANIGWTMTAPDQEARLFWSKDYSKSVPYDVMITFDAQPFLNAGLDIDKLQEGILFANGQLLIGTKLGDDALEYKDAPTPLSSYEHMVDRYRERINYHEPMDHYGIDLGNGNLFEWAKDMNSNDKDIVFVLNPEPFLEAGVDPEAIDGWLFASVPVMGENGQEIQMDKILKVFDLQ